MAFFAALLCSVCACDSKWPYEGDDFDNVVIYYGCGYNNLSSSIMANIEELCSGAVPDRKSHNALLAFCHTTDSYGDYRTPHSPVLIRFYKDKKGAVVRDTLTVYPESLKGVDESTVNTVLSSINKDFPADHYGFVFSSHGTGWIPPGYTGKNEERPFARQMSTERGERLPAGVYPNLPQNPDAPETKSIGAEYYNTSEYSYQMELAATAKAIPMRLDYIIFDACLMGGIETAYEFRNVTDKIIASPTEILKRGLIYETMAEHLLRYPADLEAVCKDYYKYYTETASDKSATIALYDCTKVEGVASDMEKILSAHGDELSHIDRDDVQRYFYLNYGNPKHWFYDIKDIAAHLNPSASELSALEASLDRMVIYKGTTGHFFDTEIPEEKYSGVSMYLPFSSWDELNDYYKTLGWNKAVHLVK